MNHKAVLVPEGTFRSPLIRVTAICCAVAAVCAFIGSISLFLPGYFMMYQVTPERTLDFDARFTWTILHCAFLIFSYLCALLMAASLLPAARGKVQEGMDLLGRGLRALRLTITATTAVAALYFVYRLVRYSLLILEKDYGIMLFVPTVLAELFMGVQAALIFVKLRQFIDSVANTAASVAHTITSGTLRAPSISLFSAVGFLILGVVNLMLFINRVMAFSAWWAQDERSVFTILLIFPAVMYLFAGIACVLLFLYLRKYKQSSEYLLYKGTPVEDAAC